MRCRRHQTAVHAMGLPSDSLLTCMVGAVLAAAAAVCGTSRAVWLGACGHTQLQRLGVRHTSCNRLCLGPAQRPSEQTALGSNSPKCMCEGTAIAHVQGLLQLLSRVPSIRLILL